MREIKFRVWNIRRKTMEIIDDLYWFEENGCHHNGDNDYVIQQYTGRKDANGVEIYEGDILAYPEYLDDKSLFEIRQDTEPYDYYGGISSNDYKIVVGNIFEGINK